MAGTGGQGTCAQLIFLDLLDYLLRYSHAAVPGNNALPERFGLLVRLIRQKQILKHLGQSTYSERKLLLQQAANLANAFLLRNRRIAQSLRAKAILPKNIVKTQRAVIIHDSELTVILRQEEPNWDVERNRFERGSQARTR